MTAAATKGLDLISYLDESCPAVVVGDGDRMRQILINLLSNAVKFTSRGEVLLTVTTTPADEDRLLVTIKVTDTGIGISADGVSRLFHSFSQVDASSTRSQGGTGLGLTISQRLARAMGGDVWVASTPGEGSTFTATLMMGASDEAVAENGPTPAELTLAGLDVLVVDDNPTNLRILDLQLSNLQMRCTTADTPTAALAKVAEGFRYDIAVVDMHMPNMSGLELSAVLRRTENAASPIILLTSLGLHPSTARNNFAAILAKPVKGSALRKAVVGALRPDVASVGQSGARHNPLVPAVQPLRILLAEDNLVNQRVAQLMLDKMGHSVDIVANGRAAVDAVSTVAYDVVLMDVQMPEMDGHEATRQIRARLPVEQQPYIIAMTANAMIEDREACTAAGMEGYLAKPVRAQELKKLLTRVDATIPHRSNLDQLRDSAQSTKQAPAPPPATPVDQAVIDQLKEQIGDEDGSALAELVGDYLVDASRSMRDLTVAVQDGNTSKVLTVTHAWKSTSAMLGATRLATLLLEAESAALTAPTELARLTPQIEQEHERVRGCLLRLQNRNARQPTNLERLRNPQAG